MKFVKYLFALAIALCATANVSHAQQIGTIQFLGGGSSALFLELGQAAATAPATSTPCVWTQKSNAGVLARDTRVGSPGTDEQGNIWVTWGPGSGSCAAPVAPYNIYSYMSLDSVLGDRCFFLDSSTTGNGCVQIMTIASGTADAGLLGAGFGTPTPLPLDVIDSLNNQNWFVAGTDIRPEDAKFASVRMFTACGASLQREPYLFTSYQTRGLGYQTGTTGVGVTLKSFYSGKTFNVLDFNITGSDPITGQPVRAYTVTTVGAQPIVIAVAPAGGTGIGAATDIQAQNLSLFLNGTYGRSTDIQGPTATNAVTTLVREPLSGTYNTLEYSNPNSAQFKTSQDQLNCSGSVFLQNPLHFASANNVLIGGVHAFRNRVIGTSEMVAELQAASTDTLGYFFWSAANASNLANAKYLTIDGVDPIADDYSVTNGVFPTAGGPVPLSAVTFKHLNAGSYPVWSALRLVSTSPTPAGVQALQLAAQTLSSTQSDFIPLSSLNVWHSHFNMFSIGVTNNSNGPTINPVTPGDLCGIPGALPEGGGDAGGANITKVGNHDFCADFNVPFGIVDKNN
jgi:hypothetical protein